MVYINDEYRFIFIENPKSGSTSILRALEKSLDVKIKRYFNPDLVHLTCDQVKRLYPDKWKSYFKFSTFRDPYERYCSSMNYELHNFIDYDKHLARPMGCVYCKLQEEYTTGCDFIIHIDNIQEGYNKICETLKLNSVIVENRNKNTSVKRFDETELYLLFDEFNERRSSIN